MNRGSPIRRIEPDRQLKGFNEAPIHESGKCNWSCRCAAWNTSFNEAPIHESGKSCNPAKRLPAAVTASMRPRFMNRGSDWIAALGRMARFASMRPRFMNRGSQADPDCLVLH